MPQTFRQAQPNAPNCRPAQNAKYAGVRPCPRMCNDKCNPCRLQIGRASCRERVSGGGAAQAEDGIRATSVSGVQTCALPIYNTPLFTLRDRRIIRSCVNDHAADFPAGATERPELPSGSERQIRRGETLSADVQRQVQSLPLADRKSVV